MFRAGDPVGPFALIEKIGRGTFGEVWLAEEKTAISTHRVALKLPNEEDVDLDAIRQEADVWEKVKGHPNILPIIKADNVDGQIYIASEYAPDGSLYKWLKQREGKAPTVESAVKMIEGILAGLGHLHSKSVIHRDLKPDNILLQADTPRIADFGIARLAQSTSNSTQVTGTPAYMAPECFYAIRSVQTDIWAIGIIFHLLLTGKLPFPQPDQISIMNAVLNGEPQIESAIPAKFERIIRKCLQKEPQQRFQTVAEIRSALSSSDALAADETVLQPTVKFEPHSTVEQETLVSLPVHRNRQPVERSNLNNLWKIATVILVLTLGGAAAVWYGVRSNQKDKIFSEPNSNVSTDQPPSLSTETNTNDSVNTTAALPDANFNTNIKLPAPSDTLPSGEGYNPWSGGSGPPIEAPLRQESQTFDNKLPESPFLPPDNEPQGGNIVCAEDGKCYYVVPSNPSANANVKATPKTSKSPSANVIQPTVEPNDATRPRIMPTPELKLPKPTPQPKNTPSSNPAPSGKIQDN